MNAESADALWVGVDVGTCRSSAMIRRADGSTVRVSEPLDGGYQFPSSVSVTAGGQLLAGTAAENVRRSRPAAYRGKIKRHFGETWRIRLGGQAYRPDELMVALLRLLFDQACRTAGRETLNAVVTVPASYENDRRGRMAAAALDAGFGRVEVVDEPVAAAGFALAETPLAPGGLALVYDLGGGTFDAALVQADLHGYRVIDQRGASDCGGDDFDVLIFDDLRRSLPPGLAAVLTGPPPESGEMADDALRLQRDVAELCRRAKHQLSHAETFEEPVPGARPTLLFSLTRRRFEELIADYVEKTIGICAEMLSAAGVAPGAVSRIVVVGGSTRIPAVTAALERRFDLPLAHVSEPELAVAEGAARWAPLRFGVIRSPVALTSAAVSRDGAVLVGGGADGSVRLWTVRDGAPGVSRKLHRGAVSTVDISGDGRTVASGARDGQVVVWPVADAGEPRSIALHDGLVNAIVLTSDIVVSAGDDGWVRRTSCVDGAADYSDAAGWPVEVGRAAAGRLAIAADRTVLAVAGSDGLIRLFDGRSAEARSTIDTIDVGVAVRSLVVGPDGRFLAAGCTDGKLRVWNLADGGLVAELPGHAGAVRAVALDQVGWAGTGDDRGDVRLWQPDGSGVPGGAGREVGAHLGAVRALAFLPDGRLLSVGADKTARIWATGARGTRHHEAGGEGAT